MTDLLSRVPLHSLLVPAYAVLFLYAANIGLVRPAEVIAPLAWTIAAGAALLAVLALATRDLRAGGLICSALLAGFFFHGHLIGLIGDEEPPAALLLVWLLPISGAVLVAWRWRSLLPQLTAGLNVLTAVLVALSLATVVPALARSAPPDPVMPTDPSGLAAQRTTQRDIYYLVFDRYGSEAALGRGFGITDNDLPDWLAERGFEVARDSYANYVRTTLSLAAVLDLEYLDDVAARMGPNSGDYGPLHALLQRHRVGRFLREQGYRYVHVGAWFNPTRALAVADENLEHDTTTEFELVLYETTVLPSLQALVEHEPLSPDDQKHLDAARFQFRQLPRVIAEPGPKFVTAHVLLPHDPYVFDAAGNFRPPAARRGVPEVALFRDQLEYTNELIRGLVEQLLDVPPDERPIIIIQADEGPYPTRFRASQREFDWAGATTDELVMKFGILNAFYLPPEASAPDEPAVYPSISSVNTFRLVLARYFGVDLPLLPDRVFTSARPDRPYDLTDITDRLPAP
ncbi:MAG TPA: hypothetical protein VNW68_08800 [Candidatus Limnocylindria bacterium]|nr:hypothetical protein [Candidatus Limnocylindria bacterium]